MDKTVQTEFGQCSYGIEDDFVHIYDLYIPPCFRQQGRARKILQQAIEEIRLTGYAGEIQIVANPYDNSIDVNVLASFYKRMGLAVYSYYG